MSSRKYKQQLTRSTLQRARTSYNQSANKSGALKSAEAQQERPKQEDTEGWKVYWVECGQSWRREPEIIVTRQQALANRYALEPDIDRGKYPLSGMKLKRADVEWLLATYQKQFTPEEGLDVRGANLDGEDLSELSLQGLQGGLYWHELDASEKLRKSAAVSLKHTNLRKAQLQGAHLSFAQLQGAYLYGAQLQGAFLNKADLQEARLDGAHLQNAEISEAHLEGASLASAHLEGTNLRKAQLQGSWLKQTHLEDASLASAHLEGAYLRLAHLQRADLSNVHLQNAKLYTANLQGANLREAQLQGADLREADLQNADLRQASLEGANLTKVTFGDAQKTGPRFADVYWEGSNLALVDWSQITLLGDEHTARQNQDPNNGRKKDGWIHVEEYQEAVRSNRQLAVALEGQGLNEDVARFAYRSNVLQRKVLWYQMTLPRTSSGRSGGKITLWSRFRTFRVWLFSHLLNLLAGYGYKGERSFLAYLLTISGFMGIYLLIGAFVASPLNCPTTISHALTWNEALILSLSSFHGRGFFPSTIGLGDPYASAAVIEAAIGLIIEVSLIATFTRRFFGK